VRPINNSLRDSAGMTSDLGPLTQC
jgi:hypothetical protein